MTRFVLVHCMQCTCLIDRLLLLHLLICLAKSGREEIYTIECRHAKNLEFQWEKKCFSIKKDILPCYSPLTEILTKYCKHFVSCEESVSSFTKHSTSIRIGRPNSYRMRPFIHTIFTVITCTDIHK